MEGKVRSKNERKEEISMVDLNREKLKTKTNSDAGNVNDKSGCISEKLNKERLKALETLEKSQRRMSSQSCANKENVKSLSNTIKTPRLDKTDYVPLHRPNTINISDLITDESITLETSPVSCAQPPGGKDAGKISFEPTEITGRSTLYKSDLKQPRCTSSTSSTAARMSVSEILASSFAPKARNLAETLRKLTNETLHQVAIEPCAASLTAGSEQTRGSLASSLSTSLNNSHSHSLLRTADLSVSRNFSDFSLADAGVQGFSFCSGQVGAPIVNEGENSITSNDEFVPGELMHSQMLLDEISWAEKYAAIPAAALSKEAKVIADGSISSNTFEPPSTSNSMLADDPNFSVGKFFNMRSDNIWDIVKTQSPDKCRTPVALVSDTEGESTVSTTNVEETPKIDNKTYSRPARAESSAFSSNKISQAERESRDSGHGSHNSYLLSLSAIDRALTNLDIHTDDSEMGVIDEILSRAKKGSTTQVHNSNQRNPQQANEDIIKSPEPYDALAPFLECVSPEVKQHIAETYAGIAAILENKENIDPQTVHTAERHENENDDTLSFSESVLNSSDIKQLQVQRSAISPRSPLSPLQLPQPIIRVTDENEADVDEWPSTPIKSPFRRVRRHKSPDLSVQPNIIKKLSPTVLSTEEKTDRTPVNKPPRQRKRSPTPSPIITVTTVSNANDKRNPTSQQSASSAEKLTTKTLSSTRLENSRSAGGENCVASVSTLASASASSPASVSALTSLSQTPTHTRNSIYDNNGGHSNKNCATPSVKDRQANCESPSSMSACASVSFDISPMCSPHNFGNSCSPAVKLNNSVKSMDGEVEAEDRRYRTADAIPSPVASEPGARRKYSTVSRSHTAPSGAPPSRSCSCSSLQNTGAVATNTLRSSSRCSSNTSEFSHREGKPVPLKVTTFELCWSSTKLRTNSRKSMQVKNNSGKRLVVRIEVRGPGFEIVNAHSKLLTLQSQECRSIVINFCPTVTGAAVGALGFCSPPASGVTGGQAPFLEIALYAYGGHAGILTQQIYTGPVGAAFLPMGDLQDLQRPLQRSFKLHNKGSLLGFACVTLDSNGLNLPRLSDAFEVRPQRVLIAPGETVSLTVHFQPKREDIKKIVRKIQHVLTLANMRVITGDEANRQRMRRLLSRLPPSEQSKLSSNSMDVLWSQFPSEVQQSELENFKEQPPVAFDLLGSLSIHEIALTLNHDRLDETAESSSLYLPDGDETVLFRTVWTISPSPSPTPSSPRPNLDPVDELLERSTLSGDRDVVSSTSRDEEGNWSVNPTQLDFDFWARRRVERVSLLIRNCYKSPQYFEVHCNHNHWLAFTPSRGYVQPDGGQIQVEVHSTLTQPPASLLQGEPLLVVVSMENERIEVPVKLPKDNYALPHQYQD